MIRIGGINRDGSHSLAFSEIHENDPGFDGTAFEKKYDASFATIYLMEAEA